MRGASLRRRVERLERSRQAGQRMRVVGWWPGQPQPEAMLGELLIVLKRYDKVAPGPHALARESA